MSTRVYLPGDWTGLGETLAIARMTADGGVPVSMPWSGRAHAVTSAVREQWPEADEEEWEYAAAQEAANDSLRHHSDEGEPARRLVLAVDAGQVREVPDGRPTEVEVVDVQLPGDVVAYLVDGAAAERDVVAAIDALASGASEAELEAALDRCAGHQLAWYDATESDAVLELHTRQG